MSAKLMTRLLMVCCIFICQGGCMGWFEGNSQQLGYVLAKGDSEQIAKWTMQQTDGKRIFDGLSTLEYKVVLSRNENQKEQERAIDWLVDTINKIEDWPPDQVFTSDRGERFTTRQFVQHVFFISAFDSDNGPVSNELMRRLRPGATHAQWLEEWEKNMAKLKGWQHARNATGGKVQNPPTTKSL